MITRRRVLGVTTALVLAYAVAAPQAQAPAPPVTPTSAAAPLTESERKDLTILQLKAQLTSAVKLISDLKAATGACEAQLGPLQLQQNQQALQAETTTVKDAFESTRPGWVWDPVGTTFLKKPDRPAPPKAPGGR